MNISKKLVGEGAETYLPFALSKARFFAQNWKGAVSRYIHGDGVLIHIALQSPGNAHITIITDTAAAYDFCALQTPSYVDPPQLPHNDASFVRVTARNAPRALVSTVFGSPPAWNVFQYPYGVPTYAGTNRQRMTQHVWVPYGLAPEDQFRSLRRPYFVESSKGIEAWANRFDRRWTTYGFPRVVPFASPLANTLFSWQPDYLFDVLSTYYSPNQSLPLVPQPVAPLWFRRAAVKEVAGRRFFIYTDAHSNFYAYPVSAVGATQMQFGYEVPPTGYVKVAAASFLPAGASLPTTSTMGPLPTGLVDLDIHTSLSEGQAQFDAAQAPPDYAPLFPDKEAGWDGTDVFQYNHYLWAFNNDCSKAAAVVAVDEIQRYQTETSLNPLDAAGTPRPMRYFKWGSPNVTVSHYTEAAAPALAAEMGGLVTASVVRRAVVEVDLNIAVTGSGLMDFTFSVTLSRTLQGRYFVDADYAYNDSRLPSTPGELVTASFEQYVRTDGTTSGEGTPAVFNSSLDLVLGGTVRVLGFLCVRKATGAVLRSFKLHECRPVVQKVLLSSPYFGDISASPATSPYGRDTFFTNNDYTCRTQFFYANLINQFVRVLALDLRSMSFAFEVYRNLEPADSVVVSPLQLGTSLTAVSYAFNERIQNPHPVLGDTLEAPFPPPADGGVAWTELPCTFHGTPGAYALETHTDWLDCHRHLWELSADGHTIYGGVASHPDGHSAFGGLVEDFAGGVLGVDWVRHSRRRPEGVTVTAKTHMAAFNAAYNQARTSADYASAGPYYDGTIKAYGIWRSFTPAPYPFKLSF